MFDTGPLVVLNKNSWSNFERESCVESIDRRLRKLVRINAIRTNLRSSIIRALTPKLSQEFLKRTTSACYRADRLGNPRWGLGYVITTIAPSWEMGSENTNVITEEQRFLPDINDWVSTLSAG